jgi:hypothetical protein
MYKSKDRQREAVREAVRRHRAKGITTKDVIPDVIPIETVIPVIPEKRHAPTPPVLREEEWMKQKRLQMEKFLKIVK